MHQRVVDLLAVGDGAVAGDGPGRGGPDHDRRAGEVRRARGRAQHREARPERRRDVVVVLDLGFGERGLLDRAPHHRAQAAIEGAVHQELADLADDRRLGGEVHGGVAPLPVARDAEPLELLALHVEPVRGVGAAFGAEIEHRHRVLVAALGAVLLLDLPLDRQAVAVPARDVVRVVARHLRGAVHHVLQDLVERVADVQRAVGVGRAVVQHEERAAARAFAQALPEPQALPALQHLRLALRQVALHGKGGAGQEHGAAVIARGGGGWRRYGGVGHVGASRTAACVAGGGGAWVWRAARTPALGGGPGREFAHGRGARRPAGPCSCYGKMGGCGSSGTQARGQFGGASHRRHPSESDESADRLRPSSKQMTAEMPQGRCTSRRERTRDRRSR